MALIVGCQVSDILGGRSRTRTYDPLIKSQQYWDYYPITVSSYLSLLGDI
jgi:hypothetical protein